MKESVERPTNKRVALNQSKQAKRSFYGLCFGNPFAKCLCSLVSNAMRAIVHVDIAGTEVGGITIRLGVRGNTFDRAGSFAGFLVMDMVGLLLSVGSRIIASFHLLRNSVFITLFFNR